MLQHLEMTRTSSAHSFNSRRVLRFTHIMSVVDVEAAARRVTGTANYICFTGKNNIPNKISFSVRGVLLPLPPKAAKLISSYVQVSSDRRRLEFKKGKMSLVSEHFDIETLEVMLDRIDGFPKDSDPSHVSYTLTCDV